MYMSVGTGRLVVLALAAALAACASLNVDRMMPTTQPVHVHRFDGTLHVLPVTGAQPEQFGGAARISNEMFREALVSALRKSNLFRRVETNQAGDYQLRAEITTQDQTTQGLDYVSLLGVRYRIVDTRSGAELWRREINSRHLVAVSQALSGATRTVTAQEATVRDNLTRMLTALAAVEPK